MPTQVLSSDPFAVALLEKDAEIERLTAERDRWQHDALGWSDRLTAATYEIERLRAALQPFGNAVYNDNGDMTITPCGHDDYVKAYFVMRAPEQQGDQK